MLKASISILIITFISASIHFHSSPLPHKSFYHSLFLSTSHANESISNHLYTLTRRPHVAGSQANAQAAAHVLSSLTSSAVQSRIASYRVSLAYPESRSLSLLTDPPIHFALQQRVYAGDPYAYLAAEIQPTFHAYAKSGTAVGPVAYANYGRVEDYATLKEMGVNVSGSVVLARYGEIYRGDIVGNAYTEGAVGVLIFTDAKDFGGGEKWFPDDRWMPPSGVQVGSVYNGVGDPTTPGWPSTDGCERLSDEQVVSTGDVPLIPSLPISWEDADVIIRSIDGQVAAGDWQGGVNAPVYRVGPGPGVVNLTYKGKQVITRIEDVIGVIEGAQEPDRYVILGNHRDAWTFGAVDPNSGTACLLEVAERLYKLQQEGWKPRRTIIFCNWDAEEYGLIGSTEWVEENKLMLGSRVVAYLNVDIAVAGAGFEAYATPQLDELLIEVSKQVSDPENSSQSIFDSWTGSTKGDPMIGRLGGGGSDYAAFVQHIGVPSVDISFGGGYPVYHSMYDDFIWMSKFGDPMFQRHVAAASLWGLVALRLADDELLPFNYRTYAHELQKSAQGLKVEVSNRGLNLAPLFKSIGDLEKAATKINDERKALMEETRGCASTWKDGQKVRELNDRLMMAERGFTDREGLQGRWWYKHLIYGPSKHNDYGSKSFPGIDDAIEMARKDPNATESWQSVQREIWRVSRVITQASLVLGGVLT